MGSIRKRLSAKACKMRTEALTHLQCGRDAEAKPLLEQLERLGCAQSAFNLAIMCCRRGRFAAALDHLHYCKQSDPAHPRAAAQMTAIIEHFRWLK